MQTNNATHPIQSPPENTQSAAAATELGGAGAKPFLLRLRADLGVDGLIRDMCFLGGYVVFSLV